MDEIAQYHSKRWKALILVNVLFTRLIPVRSQQKPLNKLTLMEGSANIWKERLVPCCRWREAISDVYSKGYRGIILWPMFRPGRLFGRGTAPLMAWIEHRLKGAHPPLI
jgi:hypothetical protein